MIVAIILQLLFVIFITQDLLQYKTKNKGSAKGFSGASETGPEIMFEKHDILVVAAMEKTLTQDNAEKLSCKV